jgi:ABC-2 type transport system ATP-binding protein
MHVVETQALTRAFGSLTAVDRLDLTVGPAQVVGLIGPNGAGKTTLLRMMATLLPPTRGSLRVLGTDAATGYLAIRRRIGFLPDFFNLYNDLTLRECLRFFANAYGVHPPSVEERVSDTLKFVELTDKADDRVRHLSRGMVQRLGLATLMVRDPDLYLLDEPASGLDPKARIQLRIVLKRLRDTGRTIIVSSHILPELSDFCTHVAIMDRGRLAVQGEIAVVARQALGGRRIEIGFLGGGERAAAAVAGMPGFAVVETSPERLVVETAQPAEAVAALNRALVEAGVPVVRLTETRTNLEDIFMKVAGGQPEAPSLAEGA